LYIDVILSSIALARTAFLNFLLLAQAVIAVLELAVNNEADDIKRKYYI
jgi:hypothetical protein